MKEFSQSTNADIKGSETASSEFKNAQTAEIISQHTFGSPQEYLSILQKDFKAISRDHENITLADLQLDMNDATMKPADRAAAALTAEHYDDFNKFNLQFRSEDDAKQYGIDAHTVNFTSDMVNGNWGKAARNALLDGFFTGFGIALTGAGAMFTDALLQTEMAEGLAVSSILPVSFPAVATVGAIAVTAYSAYATYKDLHDFYQDSHQDNSMVSQWIAGAK